MMSFWSFIALSCYRICLIHSGKLSQRWFSNPILLAELNNEAKRKLAIMGVFRTLLDPASRVLPFPDTEKCQTSTPSGDVVWGTGAGGSSSYPQRGEESTVHGPVVVSQLLVHSVSTAAPVKSAKTGMSLEYE